MSASAADFTPNRVDPNAGVNYETYEVKENLNQSMAEYVKGLTMLTNSEKQLLIDVDKAAAPYYQKMQELNDKIETITSKVLHEAENIFNERNAVMTAHDKLWAKMWDNMTAEQKKLDDYIAIIKASKVLSKSEKDILVKDQTKLNALNTIIDKYYEKAEVATKDLNAELEMNITKLNKLFEKTNHIWEKVYGNSSSTIIWSQEL